MSDLCDNPRDARGFPASDLFVVDPVTTIMGRKNSPTKMAAGTFSRAEE
jgi:hypothetical protein